MAALSKIEKQQFRRICGKFASGITVATVLDSAGAPHGMTANSFTSVSMTPPLVLVCVDLTSDTHGDLRAAGAFAVSVLAADQERLARRFADAQERERFQGVAWREEATGAPVLEDAVAWVDCRVWAEYPAGDHTIFVGQVLAGDADDRPPLLYYRGGYGRFDI